MFRHLPLDRVPVGENGRKPKTAVYVEEFVHKNNRLLGDALTTRGCANVQSKNMVQVEEAMRNWLVKRACRSRGRYNEFSWGTWSLSLEEASTAVKEALREYRRQLAARCED